MSNQNTPLRIQKRLLQFNQLVFAFGWVTDPSYTVSFKGETQPYTNAAHGGYFPTFGEFGKLNVAEFSATVAFDFKKVECEDREQYARYIKRQLALAGKLWATQNGGEIIWTNARVRSINEVVNIPEETDMLRLNITFELVDGYWRIAKPTRTFLCEDFCVSRFKDFDPYYCTDLDDMVGQCGKDGTSKCFPCLQSLFKDPVVIGCYDKDTPERYESTIQYHPLCYYKKESLRQMFSKSCPNNHFIDYSCEAEEVWFCYDASWGKKFRLRADDKNNRNVTRIQLCSRTDLPTQMVRIRLYGDWTMNKITVRQLNPYYMAEYKKLPGNVLANDNRVMDSLVIGTPSLPFNVGKAVVTGGYGANIYYSQNLKKPDKGIIEISPDQIVRSNTPVFEVQPGINVFEVTGNKYGLDAFIYIETIDVTY
jgi:hypothetical protein